MRVIVQWPAGNLLGLLAALWRGTICAMRPVAVLVVLLVLVSLAALARPTHGEIRPLASGAELNGLDVYPLDVGRSWTYRDSTGARVAERHRELDRYPGRRAPITYERPSYDLSEPGQGRAQAPERRRSRHADLLLPRCRARACAGDGPRPVGARARIGDVVGSAAGSTRGRGAAVNDPTAKLLAQSWRTSPVPTRSAAGRPPKGSGSSARR